jgi:hypothetical protein
MTGKIATQGKKASGTVVAVGGRANCTVPADRLIKNFVIVLLPKASSFNVFILFFQQLLYNYQNSFFI